MTNMTKLSIDQRIKIMNAIGKGIIDPKFTEWLDENGFFTAPASTKYHGNYEGGLFDHSSEVAETLMRLTLCNGLVWQREESPFIVGMFHDLCKIDSYVKTEDGFDYNNETLIPGHGEKSVQLLAQHMRLTEEETFCIRYHMGPYEGKEVWRFYDRAIQMYDTVLWTHHADMIASKISGV